MQYIQHTFIMFEYNEMFTSFNSFIPQYLRHIRCLMMKQQEVGATLTTTTVHFVLQDKL